MAVKWPVRSYGTGEGRGRRILAALLVDLAVSPLFTWDAFAKSVTRQLGTTPALVTMVFSIGLAAFTVGVLVGGYVSDRQPPRRLILWTGGGCVGGLLGSAMAGSIVGFAISFGVVLGAGSGLGYATSLRLVSTVAERRGLSVGVVVSAYAGGTVVLAPVAAVLLRYIGLGGTLAAIGGGMGLILGTAAQVVPGGVSYGPEKRDGIKGSWRGREKTVWALWVVFGLGSAPALAAFGHAGEVAGYGSSAALDIALLSGGSLIGRLAAGRLSDRIGRPVVLQIGAGLLVLASLVLLLSRARAEYASEIALVVLGLQYGAFSALVPAATADAVPKRQFGAVYGRVFTSWGLAGLLAPLGVSGLAGTLGWHAVFLAWGATGVATCGILAIAY